MADYRIERHRNSCTFHEEPDEPPICSATTKRNKRCTYVARHFPRGRMPVCSVHFNTVIDSVTCTSIELCGKPCGKVILKAGSNTLCEKHKNGVPPCYFLKLPTELRLMIYRYVLPEEVRAWGFSKFSNESGIGGVAILQMNRQIYQEASSILYDESIFVADLFNGELQYFGSTWSLWTGAKLRNQASAQRAKRIRISFTASSEYCKESDTLAEERHLLRQFVEFRNVQVESTDDCEHTNKHLTIRTILIGRGNTETFGSLFLLLEPLQQLKATTVKFTDLNFLPVHPHESTITDTHSTQLYSAYQDHWVTAVSQSSNISELSPSQVNEIERLSCQIRKTLLGIVDFENRHRYTKTHDWFMESFNSKRMGRPWRVLQLAVENADIPVLEHLREAIATRWAHAWQRQQNTFMSSHSYISSLYGDPTDIVSPGDPRDLFPGAFTTQDTRPLISPSANWEELTLTDSAPKLSEEGVTFEEELLKVRIRKQGQKQEWIRMKTPAMMRMIKELKERNEQ